MPLHYWTMKSYWKQKEGRFLYLVFFCTRQFSADHMSNSFSGEFESFFTFNSNFSSVFIFWMILVLWKGTQPKNMWRRLKKNHSASTSRFSTQSIRYTFQISFITLVCMIGFTFRQLLKSHIQVEIKRDHDTQISCTEIGSKDFGFGTVVHFGICCWYR